MTADELEEMFGLLTHMHKEKQITDDAFHKGMVNLATEWAEFGDPEEAVSILSQIPEVYVELVLPRHLEQDPVFMERVYEMAVLFRGLGYDDALKLPEPDPVINVRSKGEA